MEGLLHGLDTNLIALEKVNTDSTSGSLLCIKKHTKLKASAIISKASLKKLGRWMKINGIRLWWTGHT
jgi:hypothetical protein